MYTRQRFVDAELHTLCTITESLDRGGDDLLETDIAHHELEGTALEAAHVEQVADERVQAVGLLVDGCQELVGRLRRPLDVLLQQARGCGLDRRQRRPQIV